MKHKTSEISGALLDAAVAKALCVGDPVAEAKYSHPVVILSLDICILGYGMSDAKRQWWTDFQLPPSVEPLKTHPEWDLFFRERQFSPSTNWDDGGPIIERERIDVAAPDEFSDDERWFAGIYHGSARHATPRNCEMRGDTPLIAAMRAYVASKLGDEVDL